MDKWTKDIVDFMCANGNIAFNKKWESRLPEELKYDFSAALVFLLFFMFFNLSSSFLFFLFFI